MLHSQLGKHGFLLVMMLCSFAVAQGNVTVGGYITDAKSGEALIGANIYMKDAPYGAATNMYGFYSITLPPAPYTVVFSYLGYAVEEMDLNIQFSRDVSIELSPEFLESESIVVTAGRVDANVQNLQMSTVNLKVETIRKVPVVLGEVDLLKSIQLLPGVTTVRENASGFNVRGGAVDQNLVLLDESPIYNSAHLMGFFSVFNSDAIKDAQLYKGGIPARYGGRLSSVLDVRQKEGNNKSYRTTGGVGLISSRLMVEGPIVRDSGSFLIAGRRSYGDLLLKAFDLIGDNSIYFYDLNLKANLALGSSNRLFVSGYLGEDDFKMGEVFTNAWGNSAFTLRWNHLFSARLFSNFSAIYSDYKYSLDMNARDLNWDSHIINFNPKWDFSWFLNDRHQFDFGAGAIYNIFQPGRITPLDDSDVTATTLDEKYALEPSAYLSFNQKVNDRVNIQYGLRLSAFSRLGSQAIYQYESTPILYNADLGVYQNGVVVDSVNYASDETISQFYGLEPRFSARYLFDEQTSLKLSYNRMRQYVHLISNNTSPTPLDIWAPSGPFIEPQIADQFAAGFFHNFADNIYEASLEIYYKAMRNQIDYVDGADLTLNNTLETEILIGEGRAYGAELFIRKNRGRLTGWLSYTLARTERRLPGLTSDDPGINNGEYYPANSDKTHDLSVTAVYEFNPAWSVSSNFIYASGTPTTYPASKYEYAGLTMTQFEDRNQQRLPAYHRLDVGVTLQDWLRGDWTLSLYNVYNHKNAYSIQFEQDNNDPTKTQAVMTYIFGIVPGITYNFQF